ncbi:cystathionine gamma-synthase [Malassezia vespertilionis]|uniref:Cystathionine gamma-synthase n=1 Tax=Malassezia vespertilionis TaxID=2020962 RepID=A0A2N1JCC6_9BASI|nr:cystathionine gamma-synthase [Malassezia vespertilionis]PKI84196.1 hypothetical protein MVES_001956 [Malassezia vespertilionis]WFD06712.1 cystathionine gamma-synthase [Malassezia vespertilionis]
MAPRNLPAPQLATRMLHADHADHQADSTHPVAPPMSLSTTFRQPHPDSALASGVEKMMSTPDKAPLHVYSRYTQDTNLRTERVLSSLLSGHALTFSSGLAAAFAVLNYFAPSVIAIRRGYFGVHEAAEIYGRGRDVKIIDLDDEYPAPCSASADEKDGIRRGATLVWVETPLNPTGEARDLAHYVKLARNANAYIAVDSTFAPPPLQDPFQYNVDVVMHSGTKYMGGHSDVLAGVLCTQNYDQFRGLWHDRAAHGAVLGMLESYLLLRSLRTLSLRVTQQSKTAAELVKWLHSLTAGQTPDPDTPKELTDGKVITHVWHSTLQPRSDYTTDADGHPEGRGFDPSSQMPNGGSPTFGMLVATETMAVYLPHEVEYFTPATSLGGVESLMEQRKISSPQEDSKLLRISTGIEAFADLKADLIRGMLTVLEQRR